MTHTDLGAIRARDAAAQCVDPRCHQTSADRRELLALVDMKISHLIEYHKPGTPENTVRDLIDWCARQGVELSRVTIVGASLVIVNPPTNETDET